MFLPLATPLPSQDWRAELAEGEEGTPDAEAAQLLEALASAGITTDLEGLYGSTKTGVLFGEVLAIEPLDPAAVPKAAAGAGAGAGAGSFLVTATQSSRHGGARAGSKQASKWKLVKLRLR